MTAVAAVPTHASTVSLHGVGVAYGQRRALDQLSIEVAAGEWVCLLGPNGAGKSSLLRAVAGLVRYHGEVRVDGEVLRSPRRRAELVAYVPQEPELPPDMAGLDYVLLGRNPYIGYFGTETQHDRAVAADVLDRLDLSGFGDRLLGELSGGERQRLVIARALAQQAPLLLLDEPTSALDIGHQAQALELVDHLRRADGLTVLAAMHDLTLAGMYADRLILLDRGTVIADGPPQEVLDPSTLESLYGTPVDVRQHPDGTITVTPRRRPPFGR